MHENHHAVYFWGIEPSVQYRLLAQMRSAGIVRFRAGVGVIADVAQTSFEDRCYPTETLDTYAQRQSSRLLRLLLSRHVGMVL